MLADTSTPQYPTKAICPILLEDYRKITVERKGETNFFTSQMIKDCMKKGQSLVTPRTHLMWCLAVIAVRLHQTVTTDDGEIEITPYYAGHVCGNDSHLMCRLMYAVQVLGACMFHVRVGEESVLYTGDYNMTPDRHLGAAQALPFDDSGFHLAYCYDVLILHHAHRLASIN